MCGTSRDALPFVSGGDSHRPACVLLTVAQCAEQVSRYRADLSNDGRHRQAPVLLQRRGGRGYGEEQWSSAVGVLRVAGELGS
jgi:hypothetical protein